jgi:N-dimethylarginine dimethylaminohydrolase
MTSVLSHPNRFRERTATHRRYLMCPPEHFAVRYAINPWMDPRVPVDRARASSQWAILRDTYRELGHRVDELPARPGLPDMVFAANGATVLNGIVLGARFRHRARRGEAAAHRKWFGTAGFTRVVRPRHVNEGEGDLLVAGGPDDRILLAGTGFRTDPRAHAEAAAVLGCPVLPLQLVDPRFYHLDTALAVLDADTVAWLPAAFSAPSRELIEDRFPDAVVADQADAEVLGLNAVSDGRHVVLPVQAPRLAGQLAERGFEPVRVDVSELLKGGGGVKCCTLEVRV